MQDRRRCEPETFLQDDFGAAFVNADRAGHECEHRVNDFRERFDDVGAACVSAEASEADRPRHFVGKGQQVTGDHHEERRRMMFIEIVDLRLEVIDVMAPFEYDPGLSRSWASGR